MQEYNDVHHLHSIDSYKKQIPCRGSAVSNLRHKITKGLHKQWAKKAVETHPQMIRHERNFLGNPCGRLWVGVYPAVRSEV